jgi:hypothetical protein
MTAMDVHPDIAHLGFLLGTWIGGGKGSYPTIDPFEYVEESTFGHVGKPFIAYTQKTKDKTTRLPLHSESGYVRPVGSDRLELVIVQPSGIAEMHEGTVEATSLRFRSVSVATTSTAKEVREVTRSIDLVDGGLDYIVEMAAVGLPLQHHLAARLVRS